ncbi:blastula protease 10-like [Diadema antillarum]|uniref:blastula protease 10-like n=1 Tax=Diadema antillarum TaxID=105358 RepID=UPI003A861794
MKMTDEQLREVMEAIDEEKAGRKKRKAVSNTLTRWNQNIVPYEISSSSSNDVDAIRAAMDHWEQHTCLRFEPRTAQHASQLGHGTYLNFIKSDGCWSYVGRFSSSISSPRAQDISIGSGCESLGVVAHEIGHAIGFHHEQSRPDRDDYVTVHFENIRSGFEGNFEKYSWNQITTSNVEYDIGSLMHYGSHGFSSNGQATITTNDPLQTLLLGNREGLRFADIKLANLIYNCNDGCTSTLSCQNGGYQGPNCDCVCPPGFSGDLCENGDGPTEPEGCVYRLTDPEGEIMSPNYPNNYDINQKCLYLIEGAPGATITLTFVDMDIESHSTCDYDSVEVRTGDISSPGPKFCGTTLPGEQVSTGNQLLVAFTSDYSVTGRGFQASYVINGTTTTQSPTTTKTTTSTPTVFVGTCGGDFTGNSGTMASPNYPDNYDNDLECVYTIEVDPGRRVELSFDDMLIENQRKCKWDSLEVNLGEGVKVPMKLCGPNYPTGSLVSVNNKMELILRTDDSVAERGFAAVYRAIDI